MGDDRWFKCEHKILSVIITFVDMDDRLTTDSIFSQPPPGEVSSLASHTIPHKSERIGGWVRVSKSKETVGLSRAFASNIRAINPPPLRRVHRDAIYMNVSWSQHGRRIQRILLEEFTKPSIRHVSSSGHGDSAWSLRSAAGSIRRVTIRVSPLNVLWDPHYTYFALDVHRETGYYVGSREPVRSACLNS